MTSKGKLFSFSTLVIFLVAVVLRNGDLLWLCVPILLYIITGALTIPAEINLKAEREISSTFAIAGNEIEVRVDVKNNGRSPLNIRLNDPIAPQLKKLSKINLEQLEVQPGESKSCSYTFTAERGIYRWKSVGLVVVDPLSLFQSRVELMDEQELVVSPRSKKSTGFRIRRISTFPSPGLILSGKTGPGTDFYSIARYASGDSLKKLNWRLSNRIPNQWVINQFEKEEIGKYCLLVNAGIMSSSFGVEKAVFESLLEEVAGISTELIRNGNRVSCIAYGDDLSIIHSGAGRNHLRRIKKRLAGLKQGNRIQLRNFKYFPLRLFPARSTILVFSQLNERDILVFRALIARNYRVKIFVPDTLQPEFFEHRNGTVRSMAIRLARIERTLLHNKFLENGISVQFLRAGQEGGGYD